MVGPFDYKEWCCCCLDFYRDISQFLEHRQQTQWYRENAGSIILVVSEEQLCKSFFYEFLSALYKSAAGLLQWS